MFVYEAKPTRAKETLNELEVHAVKDTAQLIRLVLIEQSRQQEHAQELGLVRLGRGNKRETAIDFGRTFFA